MKEELIVLLTATLPVSELRGALPLAYLSFKFPLWKAYLISVIGNLLPLLPLLFLIEKIERIIERLPLIKSFYSWYKKRVLKNKEIIEKYEAFGLFLFVMIPLPVTGGWTGTFLSVLLGLKKKYAIPAIIGGVCAAGIIVSLILVASVKYSIIAGILIALLIYLILSRIK